MLLPQSTSSRYSNLSIKNASLPKAVVKGLFRKDPSFEQQQQQSYLEHEQNPVLSMSMSLDDDHFKDFAPITEQSPSQAPTEMSSVEQEQAPAQQQSKQSLRHFRTDSSSTNIVLRDVTNSFKK